MKKHKILFEAQLLFKVEQMFKRNDENKDASVEQDVLKIIDEYKD